MNFPFRPNPTGQRPAGESVAEEVTPSAESGVFSAKLGTPTWRKFVANKAFQDANRGAIAAENDYEARVTRENAAAARPAPAAAASPTEKIEAKDGRLFRKVGSAAEELDPESLADDPVLGPEARRALFDRERQKVAREADDMDFRLRDPSVRVNQLSPKERQDAETELGVVSDVPEYAAQAEQIRQRLRKDDEVRKMEQSAYDARARARSLESADPEQWWQSRAQQGPTVQDARALQQTADVADESAAREMREIQQALQVDGVSGDKLDAAKARLAELADARKVIADTRREGEEQVAGVQERARAVASQGVVAARSEIQSSLERLNVFPAFTAAMTVAKDKQLEKRDGKWVVPQMGRTADEDANPAVKMMAGLSAAAQSAMSRFGLQSDAMDLELKRVQKSLGLSDDEMKTAWRDLSTQYRKWEDGEVVRVQSNGDLVPNPTASEWLNSAKAARIIEQSGGSEASKEALTKNLAAMQTEIAAMKLEAYTAAGELQRPSRLAVGPSDLVKFKAPDDWAKENNRKDIGTPQFILDYERAEVNSKPWLIQKVGGLIVDSQQGNMKLASTLAGFAGAVGSDPAGALGAEVTEASGMAERGQYSTGLIGKVIEEIPSLATQMGIGRAAAVLGKAITGSAKGARIAGVTASVSAAGAQSMGATFASEIAAGKSEEEARQNAVMSGINTALITGIFQVGGLGGVESVAAGRAVGSLTLADVMAATTKAELARNVRRFAGQVLKSAAGEAAEEGIDELTQAFITSDPSSNLSDAWANALEAAKVGGFIGGAVDVASKVTGGRTPTAPTAPPTPPAAPVNDRVVAAVAAQAPDAAPPTQEEIRAAYSILPDDSGAMDVAEAVLIERELAEVKANEEAAMAAAEQAVTDAKAAGDTAAQAAAEAELEKLTDAGPAAPRVRAVLKIAGGQALADLTDAEARSLGFTTEGKPLSAPDLKAVGLTKPLLRPGADGTAVLLDEALSMVGKTSPRARARVKLTEAEAFAKSKERAEAAQQEWEVDMADGTKARVRGADPDTAEQEAAVTGRIVPGTARKIAVEPAAQNPVAGAQNQGSNQGGSGQNQGVGAQNPVADDQDKRAAREGVLPPPPGKSDAERKAWVDAKIAERDAKTTTSAPLAAARKRIEKIRKAKRIPITESTTRATATDDGIKINPELIINQALESGMTPAQAAQYFARILDEEVRHFAHLLSGRRLWEAAGSPGTLDAWRDAHYTSIWQEDFVATGKDKIIRDLYAADATRAKDLAKFDAMPDWKKAMEGIRMMSQGGKVTEQAKLWASISQKLREALQAALDALKSLVADLDSFPSLKAEITNLENALREISRTPDSGNRPNQPSPRKTGAGTRPPAKQPGNQPASGGRDQAGAGAGTGPVAVTVGTRVELTRNGERLTGVVDLMRGDAVRVRLDTPDSEGVPTRMARVGDVVALAAPSVASPDSSVASPEVPQGEINPRDRNQFPGTDYPVPPNVIAFQPRGLDTEPLTDRVFTFPYDGTAEDAARVGSQAFTQMNDQFPEMSQRESVIIASGPDGMTKFRLRMDSVHNKVKVTTVGQQPKAESPKIEAKPKTKRTRSKTDTPARRMAFEILSDAGRYNAITMIIGEIGKIARPNAGMLKIIRGRKKAGPVTENQRDYSEAWEGYDSYLPKNAFGNDFWGKVAQEIHGMLFVDGESRVRLDDWATGLGDGTMKNDEAMRAVMAELTEISRGKPDESQDPNREITSEEEARLIAFSDANQEKPNVMGVRAGDMDPGDPMTIGGELFTVAANRDGFVTLEDGPKFGTQRVHEDDVLWLEISTESWIDDGLEIPDNYYDYPHDVLEAMANELLDFVDARGYESFDELAAEAGSELEGLAEPEELAPDPEVTPPGDQPGGTPPQEPEGRPEGAGPDFVNRKARPVVIKKDWTDLSEAELPQLDRNLEGYGKWRRDVAARVLPDGSLIQHEAIAMELASAISKENQKPGVDSWQHSIIASGVAARMLTGQRPDILEKASNRALRDEYDQWEMGRRFEGEPISVEAHDKHAGGRALPDGYVKQGDIYAKPEKPASTPPATSDRIFHDEYTGPRWTYGFRNRPLSIGTAPKGFIIGSDGPAVGRARHGTIQYPRELTKDEIYDFELEVMPPEVSLTENEQALGELLDDVDSGFSLETQTPEQIEAEKQAAERKEKIDKLKNKPLTGSAGDLTSDMFGEGDTPLFNDRRDTPAPKLTKNEEELGNLLDGLEAGGLPNRVTYPKFQLRPKKPTYYVHSNTGVLHPDGHTVKITGNPPSSVSDGRGADWSGVGDVKRRAFLLRAWAAAPDRRLANWLVKRLVKSPGANEKSGIKSFWEWIRVNLNDALLRDPELAAMDPSDIFEGLVDIFGFDAPVETSGSTPYVPLNEEGDLLFFDSWKTGFKFGRLPTPEEVAEAKEFAERNNREIFAGELPESFSAGIPEDKQMAFLNVARKLTADGVDTPEKFAAALVKIGEKFNKDFRQYSDAVWSLFRATKPSLPQVGNWADIYESTNQSNDQPPSPPLEPNRDDAGDSESDGEAGVRPGSGSTRGGGGRLVSGGGRGGRSSSNRVGTDDGASASDGTPSDQQPSGPTPEPPGRAPNPDNADGSRVPDASGVEPDGRGENDTHDGLVVPGSSGAVESGGFSSVEEVTASVPVLKIEQAGDVVFVEERLFGKGEQGVLLTNGTGTGKTFSGLGVVKRALDRGEQHVIIVAPSDKVVNDWISTAKAFFGINDIVQLSGKKDSGAGNRVVVTTYANFGDNMELVMRPWGMVVTDEAHYLSQSKDGNLTLALQTFKGLTWHHKDGPYNRVKMEMADELTEMSALRDSIDSNSRMMNRDDTMAQARIAYQAENEAMEARFAVLQGKVQARRREVEAVAAKTEKKDRPKAVMLSATPFAYHFSLEYAEGYLFEFGPEPERSGRYNSPSARSRFYMENFGYRMLFNKLTQPENAAATGILERMFAERLKREGAMRGRMLTVPFDYSRDFVVMESAIGRKIDDIMKLMRENPRFKTLERYLGINDYLTRRYLLEALKAREAMKRVKVHLALGRKAVIFHDYKQNNAFNPFSRLLIPQGVSTVVAIDGQQVEVNLRQAYDEMTEQIGEWNQFMEELDGLRSPINLIRDTFPEAGIFNGDVPSKQRRKMIDEFNRSGSEMNVLLAQRASAKEGISMHDVDGKQQRVFIDLGIPGRPTDAIQSEGRIIRLGMQSNGVIEYLTTGTNFERFTFAQTIATRASTAENLAMGENARALLQAFSSGYDSAAPRKPSTEQGVGGKESDRNRESGDPFENAVALYFTNQKKTSRTKAEEGVDYFATPEPLGLKMVEWANIRPGERVLEPSGGHGAIARFFPDSTTRHAVEPSYELAGRLALNAPDTRVHQIPFEDFDVVNKFDVVVMNPPFGTAGKTAMDHLEKAVKHLKDGGRVVALIPMGSSMGKRFDKWYEEVQGVYLTADIRLPSVTFERAGTSVSARVVVLDKMSDQKIYDPRALPQQKNRDFTSAGSIRDFFDRIKESTIPDRPQPAAQKTPAQMMAELLSSREGLLPPANTPSDGDFAPAEFAHTQNRTRIFVAKITRRLDGEEYQIAKKKASRHGGHYSSFNKGGAIPGFHFPDAESRDAFIADEGLQAGELPPAQRTRITRLQKVIDAKYASGRTDGIEDLEARLEALLEDADTDLMAGEMDPDADETAMPSNEAALIEWWMRWTGVDLASRNNSPQEDFDSFGAFVRDAASGEGPYVISEGVTDAQIEEAAKDAFDAYTRRRNAMKLRTDSPEWKAMSKDQRRAYLESRKGLQAGELPSSDAAYLALAKDPEKNRVELQRMVDEAARAAGYDVGPVYHGTNGNKFTRFKPGRLGLMFFAENENYAKDFTWDDEIPITGYISSRNTLDLTSLGYDPVSPGRLLKFLNQKDFRLNTEDLKGAANPEKFVWEREVWAHIQKYPKLVKSIKSAGYDSIKWQESNIDSEHNTVAWVLWDNTKIKSADPVTYDADGNVIPLSRRFNPDSDSILEAGELPTPFYSALQRAVEAKIPARATPEQIMATVKAAGVKAEEIKWSGVEQALPSLTVDGKVSKEALLKYLADEGSVRFEEVVAADKPAAGNMNGWSVRRRGGFWAVIDPQGIQRDEANDRQTAEQIAVEYGSGEEGASSVAAITKYSKYQLPGGENYREVVLAMKSGKDRYTIVRHGFDATPTEPAEEWWVIHNNENGKQSDPFDTKAEAEAVLREKGKGAWSEGYTSTHFPDVPNYVAHMRTNERDGGLFIEEIQSDRHQAGRKKGYNTDSPSDAEVIEYMGLKPDVSPDRIAIARKAMGQRVNAIPDAPFRTTWPLALFKRALRDAVASGKEWIGWTVGKTQADRFKLSTRIEAIRARKDGDSWTLEVKPKNGDVSAVIVAEDALPEHVGKDFAQKIVADGGGTYTGLDLDVGGDGMKGFYDNMLPKEIGRYVKQWGGKVEKGSIAEPNAEIDFSMLRGKWTVKITDAEGSERSLGPFDSLDEAKAMTGTPIHRIDITPVMRASVPQGQALFAGDLPSPADETAANIEALRIDANKRIPRPYAQELRDQQEAFGRGAVGVPRLANPGDTERSRSEQNIAQEIYEHNRERREDRSVIAEARRRLAEDPTGVEEKVMQAAFGGMISTDDADVFAARLLINQRAKEAGNDLAKHEANMALRMAYQLWRAETARQLRIGHDLYQTPAERHREMIADAIYTPTLKVQKKAKESLWSPEKRREFIRQESAARIKKINDAMKKMGVTMDEVLSGEAYLSLSQDTILKNALRQRTAEEQVVIKLHQRGYPMARIKKNTGLSESRIQEIVEKMFDEMMAKAREKVRAGMTLENYRDASKGLQAGDLPGDLTPEQEAEARRIVEIGFGLRREVATKTVSRARPKKKPDDDTNALTANWSRPVFTDGLNDYTFDTKDRAEIMARVEAIRGIAAATGKIKDLSGRKREEALKLLEELNAVLAKYGTDAENIFASGKPADDYRFDINDRYHVAAVARAISAIDADFVDKGVELIYSNILSGLKTMIVNATGGPMGLYEVTVSRGIEAAINAMTKDPMAASFAESKYILKAVGPIWARAWSNAVATWGSELPMFDEDFLGQPADLGKLFDGTAPRIGSIGGRKGRIIRIPTRLLLATDEFNRTALASLEVGAMAYRTGLALKLKPGTAEFDRHLKIEVNTPGSYSAKLAAQKASRMIFTNPLPGQRDPVTGKEVKTEGIGDAIGEIAGKLNEILTKDRDNLFTKAAFAAARVLFVPFQRTPFNILRKGARYTLNPISLLDITLLFARNNFTIQEGKLKWTFNSDSRNAEIIERTAQQLHGGLLMLAIAAMAAGEGDEDDLDKPFVITGSQPYNPRKRGLMDARARAGVGPYRISWMGENGQERWGFNYGRIEPLGTTLGMTVDSVRMMKNGDNNVILSVIGGMVAQTQEKTYLSGLSDMFRLGIDMVADEEFQTNKQLARFAAGRMAMLLPNFIRQPVRETDPHFRERADTFMQELMYQAWPHGQKPPKRDLFGEAIEKTGSSLSRPFDILSRGSNPRNPIDEALLRFAAANPGEAWFPQPVTSAKYRDRRTGEQMEMTAAQLDRFRELTGQRFKALTQRAALNTKNPTARDIEVIKSLTTKARADAKKIIEIKPN